MLRLPFSRALLLAVLAAPGPALAQEGTADSRPAVLTFDAARLGANGAAAVGAGLRLFPAEIPPPAAPRAQGAAARAAPIPPSGLPGSKPAALPGPRAATVFHPDPNVSARVRQEVLAAALPGSPDPAALRAAVAMGTPWQQFDRVLAGHGYDPHDLADVVAAFYLIAWEVATGGDALAQPAGIAAVRGQARQMLAASPGLARMTEAERQATAETLAFHAMAIATRHNDLRQAGGVQAVMAYRQEVAEAVSRQQGIDLRRFALTAAGFQAR